MEVATWHDFHSLPSGLTMLERKLALPSVAVAIACAFACRQFERHEMPLSLGRRCTVKVGEERAVVKDKCGPPCGSGNVAKGHCKPSFLDFGICSNDCDVYGMVGVCFSAEKVVSVVHMQPGGERLMKPCSWDQLDALSDTTENSP